MDSDESTNTQFLYIGDLLVPFLVTRIISTIEYRVLPPGNRLYDRSPQLEGRQTELSSSTEFNSANNLVTKKGTKKVTNMTKTLFVDSYYPYDSTLPLTYTSV